MSDEREIDFGYPPIGSPLWRIRMDEANQELAKLRAQTDQTLKAMVEGVEKIFREVPF